MDEPSHETFSELGSRGNSDSGNARPRGAVDTPRDSNNFYLELNTSAPNSASTLATHRSSISSTGRGDPLHDWLQAINMSEYYDVFTKNDISFDMLSYLTKSELKELIFKVGDRIRIVNAINELELSHADWMATSPIGNTPSCLSPFLKHQDGGSTPEYESENHSYGNEQLHYGSEPVDPESLVTVKFHTLQRKALHLDVSIHQDIIQLVRHSAKLSPKEKVRIDNGFDIFNTNAAIKDAIFERGIVEFWINQDPNGIYAAYRPNSARESTPRSATLRQDMATSENSLLETLSIGDKEDDTLTLRSGQADAERPTSMEVARNISQFFPDSKQELLAEGLRNSVMLNRRLSTVSSDWRSSARLSKRLSLSTRADVVRALPHKDQQAPPDVGLQERGTELDSGLLEQLDHEEMSPTQWLKGKLIGSGSFGSVYLAFNVFSGDILAVKQVQVGGMDQRQKKMLEVLNHEIHMLRTLEHDNIVQYRGFKKEGDFLNIFLEYIPGGSLASKLAFHGAFKEFTVKHYISQCLAGLSYLHEKGIIHRDIKGANILVDTYDRVKISDFGLSKRENADKNRISMQGTAFWMAPEVARAKEKTTTKADIWSLGCLIVELITAQHPFPDLQVLQVLYRVGKGETPNIPEDASPELKEVLSQCFIVDPNERASAQQLLQLPFFAEH